MQGQQKKEDGPSSNLSWEKFPNFGLSKTYNLDAMVPDSAATAFAIMSGTDIRCRARQPHISLKFKSACVYHGIDCRFRNRLGTFSCILKLYIIWRFHWVIVAVDNKMVLIYNNENKQWIGWKTQTQFKNYLLICVNQIIVNNLFNNLCSYLKKRYEKIFSKLLKFLLSWKVVLSKGQTGGCKEPNFIKSYALKILG